MNTELEEEILSEDLERLGKMRSISSTHFLSRASRISLRRMPLSARLFVSLMLCVIALGYVTLLATIWFDTEMKMTNIIEGYSTFQTSELVEHTFKYLPWFIGAFGVSLILFFLTSFPETLKRVFAVLVPLVIVSDMGSMWLIRYHPFFAWQLFASGLTLAVLFLVLFLLVQCDLWLRRRNSDAE